MPIPLQNEALEIAQKAMARYYIGADMAKFIRDYFMEKDAGGGEWHVAVGRCYGAAVTHEAGTYIYFYISHYGFLIFKSGDI